MTQELEAMRKAMIIRNYAEKTTSTYVAVLKKFLSQLDKPIDSLPLKIFGIGNIIWYIQKRFPGLILIRWSVHSGSIFKKLETSIGLLNISPSREPEKNCLR